MGFVTSLRQILCSWSLPAWSETLLMVRINETQEGQMTRHPDLQRTRVRSGAVLALTPTATFKPV